MKLRPHVPRCYHTRSLFIEIGWLKNYTNTKKRLTRINRSHALHSYTTSNYSKKVHQKSTETEKTAVTHQRFPHVGPHFPHSKTITTMTRLHDKNDNDQMMAITASWFFLSYGETRQNSIWQRIFHRIFHRKSRAHIDCNNLVWIRPQFQYQIFNTLPRRSRKRRTHTYRGHSSTALAQ